MKNIIVPMDFSAEAKTAFRYGIQLANQMGSNIHLIHVLKEDSRTNQGLSKMKAMQELGKVVQLFERQMYHTTFVKTNVEKGQIASKICAYAKTKEADLVLLPGGNGWREISKNSNISRVIAQSKVPVLIVPTNFIYRPIKKITSAIDKQVTVRDSKIAPLIEIAKVYQSKINILQTFPTNVKECVAIGFESVAKPYSYQTFPLQSDQLNEEIQGSLDETGADMLCLINSEHGLSSRFLNNAASQAKPFGHPIPLLLLPEKLAYPPFGKGYLN